jgi:hypothetical protein
MTDHRFAMNAEAHLSVFLSTSPYILTTEEIEKMAKKMIGQNTRNLIKTSKNTLLLKLELIKGKKEHYVHVPIRKE